MSQKKPFGFSYKQTWNLHTQISMAAENIGINIIKILEMWANAQYDRRPAEYRWSPLFNAAMFG